MDDFLFALSSLIVVIGPWKAAIVFAERTLPLPTRTRRLVALAAVLISLVIAGIFVLFGDDLLNFFHISDAVFLVAAGLLLLVFSIRMVIGEEDHGASAPPPTDEQELQRSAWRLAAYPLAVPLIITPAAMATLVTLSVRADVSDSALIALIAAVVAVLLFDLVVFLVEAQWEQVVPQEAWSIAGRVLGVLLTAFGVSIIFEGLMMAGVIAGVPGAGQ